MISPYYIQAVKNKLGVALQSYIQLVLIVAASLGLEPYFSCSSLLVDQNVLLGI